MNNIINVNWNQPQNVKCLVTTRFGGISKAPFASFNLATHVGDKPRAVEHNRNLLNQHLPTDPVWLNQIHSNRVIEASSTNNTADACFSRQKNKVCAVLTADCLPVLFTNTLGTVVAAAHAGWQGLLNGVLEQTIMALKENPAQILIWFGPAIGKHSFEVGGELRQKFINKNPLFMSAFTIKSTENNKYLANIYQLAKIILNSLVVTNISGGGFDTMTDNRFYSYRKQQITGRMATLIYFE